MCTKNRCLIESHRGVASEAPDNTMTAYRLAVEQGYDMIELDLRFTKDGHCVAMHDKTINRFARNADGSEIAEQLPIAELTLEEACRYDYGIWFSEKYKGEPIAVLEDILALAKKAAVKLKFDNILQQFSDEQFEIFFDIIEKSGTIEYCGFTVTKPEIAEKILKRFATAQIHYDGQVDIDSLKAIAAVVPYAQLTIWQRFPNGYADNWCKVPPVDERTAEEIRRFGKLGLWLLKKDEELKAAYEIYGASVIETDGSIKPKNMD